MFQNFSIPHYLETAEKNISKKRRASIVEKGFRKPEPYRRSYHLWADQHQEQHVSASKARPGYPREWTSITHTSGGNYYPAGSS